MELAEAGARFRFGRVAPPSAMPDDNVPPSVTAPRKATRGRVAAFRLGRRLRGRSLVRLRSSIGLRLAVLMLALGLPFILYVAGNAARQASLARAEAQQRVLALARVIAARVDDVVGDNLAALAVISRAVDVDATATAANDAVLARIGADLPRFVDGICVFTRDGRNIGTLDRSAHHGIVRVANRDFFRSALRTGQVAIEAPVDADGTGRPVVVFARPVRGPSGTLDGVVTLATNLRGIQWTDMKGALPPGTVISLVNADGIVLARSLDPDKWIGKSVLGVGKAREHIASTEGVDETFGADRVPRVAGFTRTKHVPWHVFVGMPADAALSSARSNVRETIALGALSLLIGAALAAYLGARIAQPLRRLAYDATMLARGNLAHRSSVAGSDETGVLAGALNRLAQTVEERTRALQEKSAALEQSRAELETITANVPVLIAYVDAGGRFRFVNEYFRDVFGIAPERLIGRGVRGVLGRTVYARLAGRVQDVRAGMPQIFETTFTKDGKGRVFIVTCFPDYGDTNDVRGAYVVCQDISRRKHAEEALAARERFVRLIADAIPARITYIDRRDRVLFGNRRFAEYWGRSADDVVGRPLADVVTPAAFAQIKPELDRAYAGEPRHFDLVVERGQGRQFYQVDHVPDGDAGGTVHGVVTISQDVTDLREAQHALAESEKRMRMIADNLPALIAYLSVDERYVFVNARAEQMFGMPKAAIIGRSVEELSGETTYAESKAQLARVRRGEWARFQRTVVRQEHACRELVDLIPDLDAKGAVQGFYALVQDVTDLRAAQERAEASEQRLRAITDSIPSMVGYIDRERRYRFNNRYYETWLNRRLSEITGRAVADVLGADAYKSVGPNLDRAFRGERVDFDVEVPGPTGTRFVRGSYIPDVDATGEVIGVYTSSTDITPLKEVERQLERLAQKDTLTGLPNRHAFNDGIAAALRRSQRANSLVALLFLDVDDFKKINDSLGHASGDDVLREFGRRLAVSVRATDLVARLAGDEFVIVLEGIHTREECRFVARKIIAAMRPQFRAGDTMVKVTTSIGIALGAGGTTTPEALLKRADSALYAAKGHGRNTFEMAI